MTNLTLYHYPLSPFSEKIRAMLGYAGLSWQSVTVAEMPPRPALEQLLGGYRKIPVAQIGGDLFCDSHRIADEIARLGNQPLLSLRHCPPEVHAFVHHVDVKVFMALLMTSTTLPVLRKAHAGLGIRGLGRFLVDRIRLGGDATVGVSPGKAKALIASHLDDLARRLASHPYLFGDQPCHADFSAYHSLWFACVVAERPLLRQQPSVADWFARLQALGHGHPAAVTAAQARQQIAGSALMTAPNDPADQTRYGQPVRIAPADYGRIATPGTLVGSDAHSWVLERILADGQRVQVHFPKAGFVIQS